MAEAVKRAGNANLKPWKKGQSGNPKGRAPKGYSITEMMKAMLAAQPEVKEAIGKVIAAKALKGDVSAIKLLWQYLDGMPTQRIEGALDVKKDGAAALAAAMLGNSDGKNAIEGAETEDA